MEEQNKEKGKKSLIVPCATVFYSNACIMTLELVASRLIAKHLGSSLYTWTAVIGLVLAGIAFGNYLGGRIADKFNPRKVLSLLFAIASVACVMTIILNNLVGEWFWLWQFSWPVRTFCHVGIVFVVPSILLGTISPVVAKMALDSGLPVGRTVGDIYAWGVTGSIIGTFITGYFLIATMGTIAIVWTVAGSLLVMGLLYGFKSLVLRLWFLLFIFALMLGAGPWQWSQDAGAAVALRQPHDPSILYSDETPYCYVAVRQLSKNPDTRAFMQDKLRHSEVVMGNLDSLNYFYTNIYAGLTHGLSQNRPDFSAMVIGGGGYVFPQYLQEKWPKSQVDVIEIDPGVTKAAIAAFGLSADSPINSISMDARNYVDGLLEKHRTGEPLKQYDFIYEDAINDFSVPFQLVTHEFNEKIATILKDDGVYMINLIDTYDNAQFLGAVVNTIQQTFPHVHVITNLVSLPNLRDTYVVAASKQPFDPEAILSEFKPNTKFRFFNQDDIDYIIDKANHIILTDDYAPVENLLAACVRQSANEVLSRKVLAQAEKLKEQKKWQESIAKYEDAMELNQSMTIMACNEIALMQVSLGQLDQAAATLQKAIDYHYSIENDQNIIAALHLNLGTLYSRLKRNDLAKQQLDFAIREFKREIEENPDSPELYSRLGNTYASMGNFNEAVGAFTQAVTLNPYNPNYYDDLSQALSRVGRLQDAEAVLKRGITVMNQHQQARGSMFLQNRLRQLKSKRR